MHTHTHTAMASLLAAVQQRVWTVRDRAPEDQDDESVDYNPYLGPDDSVVRGQTHILVLDGKFSDAESELLVIFFREQGMRLVDILLHPEHASVYVTA